MPAYMILIRDEPVRDEAAMAQYQQMNRANAAQLGGTMKPLAVYGALETLEGAAPDGVVLLEFPSIEEARSWYASPEYQAALPHRKQAADYRAILIGGL